jgi:large subunit ribosomal protein L15
MQTNQLKRIHPNKKRMTVARGGKRGKTAGRGGKGQSARAGNKRRPEWRDIIKRLPKLRGRGKNSNKPFQNKPIVINLSVIEANFSANDAITPTILVEKGIISTLSGKIPAVKILGDGEITKAFVVSGCYTSGSALEKINKAGGSVKAIVEKVTQIPKVKAPKKAKEAKSAESPKTDGATVKSEKKSKAPVAEEKKKETKTKKTEKK